MASLAKGFSVFLFRLLLLVVVSLQLKIASSKTPEESLVCFTDESLTTIDTDGHKYAQSAQDWQHSVDHPLCSSHRTCDASANGIHVPTSKATVYAVPGHNAVFVVTLDSTETRLLLTVDLRAKSCSFSKLIAYPPGFLVECMRDSSTQPIWLIPVQHSSGEWMEKEPLRVDAADDGKAVNRGVSAVMEANNGQWYFYARQDLLCYMDLERGPVDCSPVAQGKCHHIAKILPVRVSEHTGVLLACTGGEGKQRMDYVALYETGSVKLTKSNYPTGQFKAIHVSSSGDFTVFVGATYITVVRTLDSSSSARQREVSVPGDVEFSIVSGKMLLYTTREADSRGLPSNKTYALDLVKVFEEGTLPKLLEGDNCTVTQQLALGEWIVACSKAMFWYRGNVSDMVHIPWLDGSARQQRCFTSLARAEPVIVPTATTFPTLPATHAPTSHQDEQRNTAAVTVSSLLVTILVAVIMVILVVCSLCSLRYSRKAQIRVVYTGPVDSPEGVEECRDDDVASLASSQPCSLPARNEVDGMPFASTDSIPCAYIRPQNNCGAYQHTRIGFLSYASSVDSISNSDKSYRHTDVGFQFGGPSVSSIPTSSTASQVSESGTPPAVENSECEQLSGVDSTGVADSGTTATSNHRITEVHTGPGPVDIPEGVEEFGCAGQRDDDAASLASSQPSSLPARNEADGMSYTSTDNVPYGSSQPQNNGGAYRHIRFGSLLYASSVDSISHSYRLYRHTDASSHVSENGTPPAVESSECEQLSGVDSTGVADSGTTVTSDQGAVGEMESTLQASTCTRTPGNGCV